MLLRLVILSGFLLAVWAQIAPAQEILRLKELPLGDRWFGVFMNDERVGFARGTTVRTRDGYEFSGEGCEKMAGMFARESAVREKYSTGNDLSLRAFSVLQTLNGSDSKTTGEAGPSGLKLLFESKGEKKEKVLKSQGPVYPPTALNLVPLVRGATPGKSYRIPILEPEDRKLKNVRVSVVGLEDDSGKKLIHLRHNRYPLSTDVWVDMSGNTVKESVRDGWIVTVWEEETTALRHLSEAAVAKKDFIIRFSRVPTEPGLTDGENLKKLVMEFTGLPVSFEPAAGAHQTIRKIGEGKAIITIEKPAGNQKAIPEEPGVLDSYTQPSDLIQSQDSTVIDRMRGVADGEKDPYRLVAKLAHWVSKNIRETQSDTLPPLETLRTGSGNCQSHVLTYISLARAAAIPTRYVSGLVYVQDRGFVYHSWAESYIGRWITVDPTLGQVPADMTHIALVQGYSQDSQVLLGRLIGNVRAKILEQVH